MMENHPLVTGLKTRLYSYDFKLNEKLTLITNVYHQNVLIPYKDKLIFDWIVVTLEEKYSDSNIKKNDLEKMWGLLNMCLENINKKGIKMHFGNSQMLTLLDRVDLESENAVKSITQILQISSKWNEFDNLTSDYCLKLVQKDKCPEALMCLLLETFSRSENCITGLFLSCASKHITSVSIDAFSALCRDVMLKNTAGFEHLFGQIHRADEKYEGTHEVKAFLAYLENQGDLTSLLTASNHPSIPVKLRTLLFILASYIAGQDLYDKGKSLLLAKIDVCYESAPDLQQIIEKSLPLDIDFNHDTGGSSNTLPVSRILSEALIQVLDDKGINEDVHNTIEKIYTLHPSILPMLVPLIMSRCFCHQEKESAQTIFTLLVDMMLKMRLFPKVIFKFLSFQKTKPYGEEVVAWSKPFLQEIERGIFKVPRKQCLEVWFTLLQAFNHECTDLEKDERFWYLIAPVLGVLFNSSLLIDHNVPEPTVLKIKGYLSRTFKEVIISCQTLKLSSKSQTMYEELVSNFLVFVNVFASYKNVEFTEIKEYEDNLIKERIIKKSMGGYSKLILNCIHTNSESKNDLIKTFHNDLKELTGEAKILSELVFDADSFEDMDFDENPDCIALALHSFFVELNTSSGRFTNLINKDLWVESSGWQQESKLVDFLSEELKLTLDKPVKFDCNLLKSFPLENLPFALKLGSALLALNSLFSPDSTNDTAVILTRCLENLRLLKHVNPITFIKQILTRTGRPESCLMNHLVIDFSWCIEAVSEKYEELSEGLQKDVCNFADFFALYIDKLAYVAKFSKENGSVATALGLKIVKSFMKLAKKDLTLEAVPNHVRIAVFLLATQADLDSKQEKYVKKVCVAATDTAHFNVLLHGLFSKPERRTLVSSDVVQKAWSSILGSTLDEDSLKLGSKILESVDDTEFSNFIYQNNHPNLVHILLQMKTRDSIKILRKNRLEEVLFYLIKAGTLSYEEKLDLLTRLSRTHPLSAVAESSLISFLLVPDGTKTCCTPETAQLLHSFISNRKATTHDYAGFLIQAIRQHINHLALPTDDIDEKIKKVDICTSLSLTFNAMSTNKWEWKNLTTYIISDLVTALVSVTDQELKQLLVVNIHILLSFIGSHASEYLSANMKPDANEIFKIILDEYRQQARKS